MHKADVKGYGDTKSIEVRQALHCWEGQNLGHVSQFVVVYKSFFNADLSTKLHLTATTPPRFIWFVSFGRQAPWAFQASTSRLPTKSVGADLCSCGDTAVFRHIRKCFLLQRPAGVNVIGILSKTVLRQYKAIARFRWFTLMPVYLVLPAPLAETRYIPEKRKCPRSSRCWGEKLRRTKHCRRLATSSCPVLSNEMSTLARRMVKPQTHKMRGFSYIRTAV